MNGAGDEAEIHEPRDCRGSGTNDKADVYDAGADFDQNDGGAERLDISATLTRVNKQPTRSLIAMVARVTVALGLIGLLSFIAWEIFSLRDFVAGPGALNQPVVMPFIAKTTARKGDVVAHVPYGGVVPGLEVEAQALRKFNIPSGSPVTHQGSIAADDAVVFSTATTSSATISTHNIFTGTISSVNVRGASGTEFVSVSATCDSAALIAVTKDALGIVSTVLFTTSGATAFAAFSPIAVGCSVVPSSTSETAYAVWASSSTGCTIALIVGDSNRRSLSTAAPCAPSGAVFGQFLVVASVPVLVIELATDASTMSLHQTLDFAALPEIASTVKVLAIPTSSPYRRLVVASVASAAILVASAVWDEPSRTFLAHGSVQVVSLLGSPLAMDASLVGLAFLPLSSEVALLASSQSSWNHHVMVKFDVVNGMDASAALPVALPSRRPSSFRYSAVAGAPTVVLVSSLGDAVVAALKWKGGNRIAGVALHDAVEGSLLRVGVAGVSSVHSKLTPGALYAVGANATLVLATAHSGPAVVGKAVSSSELIIAPLATAGIMGL